MNRALIAGAAFLAVLLVPALAAGESIFGRDDTTSTLPSQPASQPATLGDDEVEVKGRE